MTPSSRLAWIVASIAWLTALAPLRIAGWLLTLYLTHGGGWSAALRVAAPSLAWAAAYIAAGILYLRTPTLRLPLPLAAAVLAVLGGSKIPSYVHQLTTLNPWHNVLATGLWETIGCATFALAALLHLLATRFARPRHAA